MKVALVKRVNDMHASGTVHDCLLGPPIRMSLDSWGVCVGGGGGEIAQLVRAWGKVTLETWV